MGPQGGGTGLALSPDGSLLVYVASTEKEDHPLFLRRLDQLDDAKPLAGTEHTSGAFFSPDGQWIGFFTNDKLKKVSIRGGAPITLCDISANMGASWGDDGHIVFSSGKGLRRVSAAGGPVEELMDESFMESHGLLAAASPVILPGEKSVLFLHIAGISMNEIRLAALTLETGEVKFLLDGALPVTYHPTGHLIYIQERAVMAAPFDPGTLEITGPAVPMTEENMALMPVFNFPALFDFSTEGTLVYVPGTEDPPGVSVKRTLVWVDREGNEEPLGAPPRPYIYVDLAPDGTHAAVVVSDPQDPFDQGEIWILDLTRESVTRQRLTFDPHAYYFPMWTPDSQRVVVSGLREGAFNLSSMAANGTGPVESLHSSRNALQASAWSADGRSLIFMEFIQSNSNIWALSLDDEPTARPLMTESFKEEFPVISPDGRWIAYESDQSQSGSGEIYVRPFPNLDDGKWLISTRGGEAPMWAPNGRELYYYAGRMMAVMIETEPAFAAGNPEVLFRGEYFVTHSNSPYDISPDGQRFLMMKEDPQPQEAAEPVETPPITELIVVDNWDEVLRRITPVEGR
jgi:serine/threonine-protein kinase